jgi:expansin (peptidoglycan-binding protein)
MLTRERIIRHRGGVFAAAIIITGLTAALGAVTTVNASVAQAGGLPPLPKLGIDEATHYAPTPQGNCSYPSAPADGLYAALPPSEYAGGAACGEYLDVQGLGDLSGKKVRVEVIDQCPECATGHIDLSEKAFSQLDVLKAGIIAVTYQKVTDPPLTAPLSVKVKEGSSASWLALLPMNTGNPLASVQVQNSAGGWDSLTRSGYGYWIAQQGEGAGPFTVKLTDTNSHTVTLTGITLSPGTVQNTSTWMYGGSASTPALPGFPFWPFSKANPSSPAGANPGGPNQPAQSPVGQAPAGQAPAGQ